MNGVLLDPTVLTCDCDAIRVELDEYYDRILAWNNVLSSALVPLLAPTDAFRIIQEQGLMLRDTDFPHHKKPPNLRDLRTLIDQLTRLFRDPSTWCGPSEPSTRDIVTRPSTEELGVVLVLRPAVEKSLEQIHAALTGRHRGKRLCFVVKTAPSAEVDIRPSSASGRRAIVRLRLLSNADDLERALPTPKLLRGMRVLIVGRESSRQICIHTAESLGAKARFEDIKKDKRVASALRGSTYDWYIRATDYGSHVFNDHIKKNCLEDRVIYPTQSGISALRKALLEKADRPEHRRGSRSAN